ncbi:sugar phosphorylase [Paenibacillus cremeus]|uniref:Sucrose phosphorylase n=1 Tax=Paenibacillus cremeus TaxID=2163881 RepID=A0A559K773_9BACL|nr:sugar phosphorylase [Paenibacillus cremeus]TVY07978.1 alpha-amylase [Paenibacillus cremeus]
MNKEKVLQSVESKLKLIYKNDYKTEYMDLLSELISKWEKANWMPNDPVTQKNVYLITYGDSIYESGVPTLETLNKFLQEQVNGVITDVHLLPMFEYTSDDGFSVVDYRQIDKKLGDWNHIQSFAQDFRMMYDFVANHLSKSSSWFQGYLNDEEEYKDFFIPHDENFDYSKVIRPRTSPLFHEYKGKNGVKTAWTTFSEDQVDVNPKSFSMLKELTDVILLYANKGASSIRLDAIGFLWKVSGTSCMHLKETHEIIKLWRILLDYFKKDTQIITETNVPHKENISYLGDGTDEAHMVYQFALPPLVLHTMTTHDSSKLTRWAKTIDKVSETATYFNFLASHDGIGVRATEGILTDEERKVLVDKVVENGGRVSYKNNTDGTQSVYELNINYFDALVNQAEDQTLELKIKKMLAAHSILLSFVGVPAIYYNSLFGSTNDYKGLEESGINRRINREKFEFSFIKEALVSDERRSKVFNGLKALLQLRQAESAFSPYASQNVIDLGPAFFALERVNDQTGEKITFILNVTAKKNDVTVAIKGTNILNNEIIDGKVELEAYEFAWIKA